MESNNRPLRTTPKDFFLHLGIMVALYAATISLISLLYGIINFYFPDFFSTHEYYRGSIYHMNSAVAAFIVTFPTFLVLARSAERDMRKHPQKHELWIRKWLTFLTLFVAGVTIAVDLIVLIKYFFDGELTMRFFMKVIVVFLISTAIFSYFMYELRSGARKRTRVLWTLASLSSTVAIAVVIFSFTVIGSPFNQRGYRLDETRVEHLSNVTYNIIAYRQNYGDVPETLAALERNGFIIERDPRTGAEYEFRKIGDTQFELCATFEFPTRRMNATQRGRAQKPPMMPGIGQYAWEHDEGRTCFEREIFPDQLRTDGPYAKPLPVTHP
ncbi:MAG: hypothetical protein G01um101448_151 [Parcubacteria group bacterium Gr01-1014_48]|nr:MAG: hypothetical protein Greene041614_106 [Parcubacteria group bacterium Greene0416_14]TSC74424.1 MAG: hypothetical protein G01um101448_151 [Parcubacteria group bacterium Gr01-1014_48]TSD01277.1 MAG: hypothetical protein Greene101415_366 [Parcubacteria group bacterium Greene1014_15]TSD08402.1 MAG: hypothetical protein Greene07144_118 [Parcubacteria group bacterium Greene0714_4]